jgi:DNA oxidative demethylase
MSKSQGQLFDGDAAQAAGSSSQALAPGLVLLRAHVDADALMQLIQPLLITSPLRHMTVPGGGRMAVAMSNCGAVGWTSSAQGYRYAAVDPLTGQPWPVMPDGLKALAQRAARAAGFEGFTPDVCLINRYQVGAGLGLHRDSDEADMSQPIVSVSIGATAQFLWGGLRRRDPLLRMPLHSGDVLVWGGPARLTYHGVSPLRSTQADGQTETQRFNLTFRRAA